MRVSIHLLSTSLVLSALLSGTSSAQMSQKSFQTRRALPSEPALLTFGAGLRSENDCQYFVDIKFPKPKPADLAPAALGKLEGCVEALDNNTPDPNDVTSNIDSALQTLKQTYNLSTPDQVDEQLITTHYLIRVMRRWADLNATSAADVLLSLDSVDLRVRGLMRYVGLLDPFAGSLVAGPAFGETGKLSPGTTSAGSGSTSTSTSGTAAVSSESKTTALAHVEWGSKHFGDESWSPVDFSFGGSFGLQPSLTLLTNPPPAGSSTSSTSSTATTSQYQSAFVWSLNAHGNLHTGSSAEASSFVRAGQVRLLSGNGATVVDQGANSTLEIPLNSNADRMAWFYEGGVEFNYYSKALEVIHAEKGQLDPAFNIALAYKLDTRFKRDAGVIGFDSPDRRLVFRFLINGLKIFDRRPDTTASKPYTISFGVEHERGFGTNPVPSGTQIIIRGDINLLKLISPTSGN
jgi:hypothetical protein